MSWKRKVSEQISNFVSMTKLRPRSGHRVLMYHSIADSADQDLYAVSEKKFTEQIGWIADHGFSFRDFSGVTSGENQVSVTFDDGYADNLSIAAPILLKRNIPFSVFVAVDHIDRPGYLSRAQLKELSTLKGVTIGSHGKTHRPLSRIPQSEAKEEIRVSKVALEEIISKEVRTFSFPHGALNQFVAEKVRESGFEKAGTSYSNINMSDGFLMSRTAITSLDDSRIFAQKMFGAWDWYRWIQH